MKKTIFLDRDGVINMERGDYTWRIEDFSFTPEIVDFLKSTQKKGYQHIVITNQGGIAKGLYTHVDVGNLHLYMVQELKKEGVDITDIFYSPYHDISSKSLSRKPDSLMIEKAINIHQVDVPHSFFIGDSERDIVAATKANIKGLKIEANGPLLHFLGSL